jgi:polyisoprenoid-binding protein YceI
MTPFIRSAAVLVLAAASAASWAQQKLIPAQSNLGFVSKQMGVPVEGAFKRFDAQVAFDPKNLAASKVAFVIDLTSVDIGDAGTMAELKKPGWFDSAKVPSAQFASTGMRSIGPGKYEVAGNLSIKGIQRPVVVPIALSQQAGITRAEGGFVLKRLDFKIGDGDWNDTSLVANDVQVRFRLTLSGIPAI